MNIKEFKKPCGACGHTKANHYEMVLNPKNNPKAKAGACKKEGCNCKNFWETEKKSEIGRTNESLL